MLGRTCASVVAWSLTLSFFRSCDGSGSGRPRPEWSVTRTVCGFCAVVTGASSWLAWIFSFSVENCVPAPHKKRPTPDGRAGTQGRGRGTANMRWCYSCGGRGHKAAECPTAIQGQGLCYNCHEPGHVSKACPHPRVENCYNCLEDGHISKNCTRERVKRCFGCGEASHLSRDCPNQEKKKCFKCGAADHIASACRVEEA
jgi:cellular nucleic acid-binding protein